MYGLTTQQSPLTISFNSLPTGLLIGSDVFLSLNTNDKLQFLPVFLFFLDFSDALQYRFKIFLILIINLIGLALNDHSSCWFWAAQSWRFDSFLHDDFCQRFLKSNIILSHLWRRSVTECSSSFFQTKRASFFSGSGSTKVKSKISAATDYYFLGTNSLQAGKSEMSWRVHFLLQFSFLFERKIG